jgi:hypothetical protein
MTICRLIFDGTISSVYQVPADLSACPHELINMACFWQLICASNIIIAPSKALMSISIRIHKVLATAAVY